MSGSVLLLDDDHNVTKALYRELRPQGYSVFMSDNGPDALDILRKEKIDIVITDQKMPHMSGSEFLDQAMAIQPQVVPIMLSGYANFDNLVHAINCGSLFHFISKPWDREKLLALVKQGIQKAANNRKIKTNYVEDVDDAIDPFVVVNCYGEIIRANATFIQLIGYKKELLIGSKLSEIINFEGSGRSVSTVLDTTKNSNIWSGSVHLIHKSSKPKLVSLTIRKHEVEEGEEAEFVVSVKENLEAVKLKTELDKLATQDMTSGALNRDVFTKVLASKIETLEEGNKLALAVIRIPKVEELRISLGETVFKSLCFKLMLRIKDLSSNDNVIGRISDDKFGVLSNAYNVESYLKSFIEELSNLFVQSFDISDHCIPIIPEIGISIFPDEADTAEKMLSAAFTALSFLEKHKEYDAVNSEKNENLFYRHHHLNRDLLTAIENENLSVEFQPIIHSHTGQIVGMESLVRWYENGQAVTTPQNLINHAESLDLISDLDDFVRKEAFKQATSLHQQGAMITVSINASSSEVASSAYCDKVLNDARIHGISTEFIIVEITETCLLSPSKTVHSNIENLRNAGVRVYLDDFGTGFTSFKTLTDFKVDGIKIDKSFVLGCDRDKTKRELIKCLISLANALDLKVTAEGVETNKQLEFLLSQNQELQIQGYLFGRPMPSQGITNFVLNSQIIS